MRTARRMGLRTIAVYSDADRDALHVREADAAVRIGGAAPRESYLNIAAIIDGGDAQPAPTRCIRATASSPRTRISRRP